MGFLNNFIISVLVTLKIKKRTQPNDKDFLKFFRDLSVYLETGFNINEALKFCQDTSRKIMLPVISKILKLMDGGTNLEDAMKKTNVFPRYMCDLMQAGRENGSVIEIVNEIILFLEQKIDIKRKVNSGLFVVKIMGFVLIFLIIAAFMVINKFKEILADTKGELPAFTQAVINVGDFVTGHWYFIVMLFIVLAAVFKYLKHIYPETIDMFKFKMPILGPIYTNLAFYRMTKIMSLVLKANTGIVESFKYAAMAVDNVAFQNLMFEVQKNMNDRNLGMYDAVKKANEKYKLLNLTFINSLRAGETSGNILKILDANCNDYKRELMSELETVSDKVVTPVLFVIFIIVAVIYTAIMLPINSIWTSAQNIGGGQ